MDRLETGGVPPDPARRQAHLSRRRGAVPRPVGEPDRFEVQIAARPCSLGRSVASADAESDASAGVEAGSRRVERRFAGFDGAMDPFVGQVVGTRPRRRHRPAVIGAMAVPPSAWYAAIPCPRAYDWL